MTDQPKSYKVQIEWADGTFQPLRDEVTKAVLVFPTSEAAVEAGNAWCDEAASHPTGGAPGFSLIESA